VGGKGAGEVDAQGLGGPVAREGGVLSSADEVMGRVEVFPGGICSREEAVGGGGVGGVLVGAEGGSLGNQAMTLLPVGGRPWPCTGTRPGKEKFC
jgi:hypothetical protein